MKSSSLQGCKFLKMTISSLVVIMGLFLMVSCKPSVPSQFIQPNKMGDVLYDYHLASSMAQISGNDSVNTIKYRAAVLKKYGYTPAQFDSSMVYYMRHTDQLKQIYEDLTKRLGKEAVALGASADAVNRFGSVTANGDTANVWNEESAMVLTPQKPFNLNSFSMVADSAFHKGDGIILDFDTQFIFQDGMRDGVVVLAVKFGNDSIATQNMHISTASHFNLTIRDDKKLGIKEIRGFFMLNKSQDPGDNATTLKLMIVSNIKLYRMHQSKAVVNKVNSDSIKTSGNDSAKSNSQRPMPPSSVPVPPNSDPNMQPKRQMPIPPKALN
ncbi:DUF4296 domain-containing protein [Prevotella sp.]|uniref:DUF4296 domain-containing protein n=1 Tax=Prevotella sp. TaxID=59823 RepID=UPI003DA3ED21